MKDTILNTFYSLERAFYRKKWRLEREIGQYNEPPDPTRLRFVDPTKIQHRHSKSQRANEKRPAHNKIHQDIGRVLNGGWDIETVPVETASTHRLINNFIGNNIKWEETDYYKKYKYKWEGKNYKQFLNSEDGDPTAKKNENDLDKYRQYILDLYETINKEGYKSQIELALEGKISPRRFKWLIRNEICVDIGRDGQFIIVDSNHRLAIAQELGVPKVPVTVVARHQKWMEKWDKYTNISKIDDLCQKHRHPDFTFYRSEGKS